MRSPGAKVRAPFGGDVHVRAKFACLAHPVAGRFVQFPHFRIGMGEDDAAGVGVRLPLAVPAVDQVAARLFAGFSGMHHAMLLIDMDRIIRPAGRQIARGVALPILPLAAYFADLGPAVVVVD